MYGVLGIWGCLGEGDFQESDKVLLTRECMQVGLLEPKYRVTQHLKHTSKPAEAPQEGSEQETEATLSS